MLSVDSDVVNDVLDAMDSSGHWLSSSDGSGHWNVSDYVSGDWLNSSDIVNMLLDVVGGNSGD